MELLAGQQVYALRNNGSFELAVIESVNEWRRLTVTWESDGERTTGIPDTHVDTNLHSNQEAGGRGPGVKGGHFGPGGRWPGGKSKSKGGRWPGGNAERGRRPDHAAHRGRSGGLARSRSGDASGPRPAEEAEGYAGGCRPAES